MGQMQTVQTELMSTEGAWGSGGRRDWIWKNTGVLVEKRLEIISPEPSVLSSRPCSNASDQRHRNPENRKQRIACGYISHRFLFHCISHKDRPGPALGLGWPGQVIGKHPKSLTGIPGSHSHRSAPPFLPLSLFPSPPSFLSLSPFTHSSSFPYPYYLPQTPSPFHLPPQSFINYPSFPLFLLLFLPLSLLLPPSLTILFFPPSLTHRRITHLFTHLHSLIYWPTQFSVLFPSFFIYPYLFISLTQSLIPSLPYSFIHHSYSHPGVIHLYI